MASVDLAILVRFNSMDVSLLQTRGMWRGGGEETHAISAVM